MKIKVRAYGSLQERIASKNWLELELDPGITITGLLEKFEISEGELMMVIKRGKQCPLDYVICENDEFQFLPPVCAG